MKRGCVVWHRRSVRPNCWFPNLPYSLEAPERMTFETPRQLPPATDRTNRLAEIRRTLPTEICAGPVYSRRGQLLAVDVGDVHRGCRRWSCVRPLATPSY